MFSIPLQWGTMQTYDFPIGVLSLSFMLIMKTNYLMLIIIH